MDGQRSDEEIKASETVQTFTSLGKWEMVGRGEVYTVRCPFKCYGFEWLLNKPAIIDGKELKVIGIEKFAHMPPFAKGELIGLLVNSMKY